MQIMLILLSNNALVLYKKKKKKMFQIVLIQGKKLKPKPLTSYFIYVHIL